VFDFRYHVASLAAVFLALIIGILVGVGISGRGLVDESERRRLNGEIAALESQLEESRARVRANVASDVLVEETYEQLLGARLRGREVALVFVGPVDAELRSSIVTAVGIAGGATVRVRALDVPIDAAGVERTVRSRRRLAGFAGVERLDDLGKALGRELVAGGQTPLWEALADQLVVERSGVADAAADGVVVVRTVPSQQGATARFLHGFYEGLRGRAPAVGVESATVADSAIDVYRRAGLSSVDNVDGRVGRVALVLLLAGGRPGHYGIKPTADGVLPPIEPVQPPPERE
jgi:hypothetical protein